MPDYLRTIKQRLSKISHESIIITEYAQRRADRRKVNLEEAYHNLLNPDKLSYTQKQERNGEERANCLFVMGKKRSHRYILVFTDTQKVKVINIIPIREPIQKWLKRTKNENNQSHSRL